MPPSAIPGFVKKKTATQRYKRSPRQLTRDITLAVELRNEDVLPHLRIRTEDGDEIEGDNLTPGLMKKLKDDRQNPMWYLRRTWLEETFGRREKGDAPPTDSEDKAEVPKTLLENDTTIVNDTLIEMLKESNAELKQDKIDLKAQLKIKDNQITETTERWKESKILTQNLHKRIDQMELQMQRLLPVSGKNDSEDRDDPEIVDAEAVETKNAEKGNTHLTKRKRTSSSNSKRKNANTRMRKKVTTHKPQWYETPTFNRWASHIRRR